MKKINYNADGVEVETDQEIYQGSHVIVTVPLGVLKTKTITFNPPLPEPKAKAIENMGFGNMEKIIFQFDEPFWRPTPQQKQNLYYVSDSLGEFPTFTDLSDTAGCPMMAVLLVGDQSRHLMIDSESLIKQATDILGTMFPKGYRKPTAVHVTNWQKDPFALGSYSAVIPTTSAEDYTHLAEPIAGRLLFAREATYRERAGYVEGAMASGLREARRILERKLFWFLTNEFKHKKWIHVTHCKTKPSKAANKTTQSELSLKRKTATAVTNKISTDCQSTSVSRASKIKTAVIKPTLATFTASKKADNHLDCRILGIKGLRMSTNKNEGKKIAIVATTAPGNPATKYPTS